MKSLRMRECVLDEVLAGSPISEVVASLRGLCPDERQRLLCSLCEMHNEIASNCLMVAGNVSELLKSECPLYIDGRATCLD
jgi:hypothetical protein